MLRGPKLYWSAVGVLVTLVVPAFGLLTAKVVLPDSRFANLPLHSLIEATGALMAVAIAGILAIESGRQVNGQHYTWMAAGLAGMGALDSFHAAVFLGQNFVWLRSTATCLGGVLVALVWWKPSWLRGSIGWQLPAVTFVVAIVVGVSSCVFSSQIPVMFAGHEFTATAALLNLVGGIGFLAAGVFFVQRFQSGGKLEDWLFAAQTILFGAAGVLFQSSTLWDPAWWWWHLLRLAAYIAALAFAWRTFLNAERESLSLNRRLFALNQSLDATVAARTSELRASEERFALAVRGSSDGLWDWNVLTGDVFYSPRFKQLLGFEDDEFPNLFSSFESRLHPDDRERTLAAVDAHLHGQRPYDVEYRLRVKSDEYRWFRARGQAIWNEAGQAERMAGSITDVTDRKATEFALQNEKFLLQTLLSNLPDAIYFKDLNGKFRRVSTSLARHLGASSPDEIVDKSDADFFPEAYAAQAKSDEDAILRSGQLITSKEERPHWANGTDSWVLTTKIPLRDQQDRIIGSFGISRDITELKNAEERLWQVVDATPNPIVVINAAGEIVLKNQAVEEVFGYSHEELIGRPIEMLLPESRREIHVRHRTEYMKCPQPRSMGRGFDLLGRRRDGSEFPIDLGLSPLVVDGQQWVLGSVIDVTKSREAERALVHAKEAAESANRAKSDFLANMSHEIRTPMNAIIGMTELVLDTDLAPSQRDYLTIVQESAESLLSIINQILDFSKIEAGKLELEQTDFDLREEVGDTLKSLALRAHAKGLELAWHVHSDVPMYLRADSVRLRQVLVNLIGNAIKFTSAGEVLVDVYLEAAQSNEATLHFSVRDTGIGIPADKLESIFLAFEQADTSTTRQFGGTGLGLAITSRIVEAMNGRTWAESEVGQGSTFHFTMTVPIGNTPEQIPEPHSMDLQRVFVVIVDDNRTNRRILQETLDSWGMHVQSVESGQQAVQALQEVYERERALPLLISDVNMPEMDGFLLVEHLRSVDGLKETPIILLTSGGRPGDITRCEQLGVCAHLMKPVKQSELLAAVMRAIGCQPQRVAVIPETLLKVVPAIRPLRILLAEDGKANQMLAVAMLEKWGHSVVVAEDGQAAVDRCFAEPFDLVLMDVQMPVMDGFEATQRIRQREQPTGKRIPIVAMTARAMTGDREKCLKAGMDGYVSKPVRKEDLALAIAPFFAELVPPRESPPPPGDQVKMIDWNTVMTNVDQDEALLATIIQASQSELPELLAGLGQAVDRGDCKEAKRFAHTMKSSGRLFASPQLIAAADAVERLAVPGGLQAVAAQLPALTDQVTQFLAELKLGRK